MLLAVSRPRKTTRPVASVFSCRCLRLSPLAIELTRMPRTTSSPATGLSSGSRRSTAIVPGASEGSGCSVSSGGWKTPGMPPGCAPAWGLARGSPCSTEGCPGGRPSSSSWALEGAAPTSTVAPSSQAASRSIVLIGGLRGASHRLAALLAERGVDLVRRAARAARHPVRRHARSPRLGGAVGPAEPRLAQVLACHALRLLALRLHAQIHLAHQVLRFRAVPRDERAVVGVVDLAEGMLDLQILERAED